MLLLSQATTTTGSLCDIVGKYDCETECGQQMLKDKGEKWIEAKAGCVKKCKTCAANKAKPNKAKAQAKGKGTAKGTAKGTRKAPSAPSAQSGRSKDKAKAQTKGKGKAKGTAKKSTKRAPKKSTNNKQAPTPHQERLKKAKGQAKGSRDGL